MKAELLSMTNRVCHQIDDRKIRQLLRSAEEKKEHSLAKILLAITAAYRWKLASRQGRHLKESARSRWIVSRGRHKTRTDGFAVESIHSLDDRGSQVFRGRPKTDLSPFATKYGVLAIYLHIAYPCPLPGLLHFGMHHDTNAMLRTCSPAIPNTS